MSYMLLIMEPPGQRATRSEAEGRAVYDRMVRYGDELRERGKLVASQSLGIADAVRVRKQDGRAHVMDGPFSEAKELVGGFYLLDCETQEEAVAIARECPAAEWCTVEVRRVAPCYED